MKHYFQVFVPWKILFQIHFTRCRIGFVNAFPSLVLFSSFCVMIISHLRIHLHQSSCKNWVFSPSKRNTVGIFNRIIAIKLLYLRAVDKFFLAELVFTRIHLFFSILMRKINILFKKYFSK